MPGSYHQGQAQEVPLLEFAPDVDISKPGILLDMAGCRPTVKGFEALPSPVTYGDAPPLIGVTDEVRGSIVAYYSDGESRLIAGTTEHLWSWPIGVATLPPVGAPTEIDSGQTFLLNFASRWRFFQFGDDVIALAQGLVTLPVAGGLVPQVAHGSSGQFGPLGGAVVLPSPNGPGVDLTNALVGCTTAGTAFVFRGQQWFASAPGVDDNWEPNVQTLAATGFLYDYPGSVTACAPFYRTVFAFKEQAIWVGSFVGPPNSWSFQLVSDSTGCRNQEAVVVLPDAVAFLGTDDFYVTTGSVPVRIPNNLKEWFFDTIDPKFLAKVYGWYDASHSVICWHFVSKDPPFAGVPDLYVEYNVRARRWAKGNMNVLDAPQPNTSVIHPAPIFFDPTSTPVEMTGPAQNVILTTGWQGTPGVLTQLLRVRPKYRQYPTTQQLMTYYVQALGQIPPTPVQTVPALGQDSWFSLRQTGRYHQAVLSTSGDMEIMALAYEARPAGVR